MAKKSCNTQGARRITRSTSTKEDLFTELDSVLRKRRPTFKKICKQLAELTMKPSVDNIRKRRKSILKRRDDMVEQVVKEQAPKSGTPEILDMNIEVQKRYVTINPALLREEAIWPTASLRNLCISLRLIEDDGTKDRKEMLGLLENFNVAPLEGGDDLCSKFTTIPTSGELPKETLSKRGSILRKTGSKNCLKRSNSISFSPFNEVQLFKREIHESKPEVNQSFLTNIYSFLTNIGKISIA